MSKLTNMPWTGFVESVLNPCNVRYCQRALKGRYPRAAQVKNALAILEERYYIFHQVAMHKGPGSLPGQTYIVNTQDIEASSQADATPWPNRLAVISEEVERPKTLCPYG